MEIKEVIKRQNLYFKQGETVSTEKRKQALIRLRTNMYQMEYQILEALTSDLGKSQFEGYMTEVGMALEEISYMLRNLKSLAAEKRVKTPLTQFSARSYIKPCPYGTVLVMSPWNYPFLLTMGPLIDAIAAGNTVVLKPSNYSSATSQVIQKLIEISLPSELAYVVCGGRETNTELLDQKFDYIFFTGGKQVGRTVLEKAAKHLTPVSLELGGKSPCIVDETADLKLAARRIVFGKFLNAGQTCVAPDYLIVHSSIKEEFLFYLGQEVQRQYGDKPLRSKDYGKIINEKHFQRILGLLEGETALVGGYSDEKRRIAPTILPDITLDSPVMQEEIFGPILPVLEYNSYEQVREIIDHHPTPLALYLFTKSRKAKRFFTEKIAYGGGCINDTIIHLATTNMGFGGVGQSGMGAYHGQKGFDTFTHYKSIVDKSLKVDLPFRYQPYTEKNLKMIKWFMK